MKSNKKFLISGIVLILITILSVIIVSNYKNIYKNAKEIRNLESSYEYGYIDNLLDKSNIYIYKELKEKQKGGEVDYKDLYGLNTILKKIQETNNEDYIEGYGEIILEFKNNSEYYEMDYNNLFYNIEDDIESWYKNLEYYIVETNNNTSLSNSDNDLSLFIKNEEDEKLNKLKDKYSYYKVISYDENGKSKVLNSNTNQINEELDDQVYINGEKVNLSPKNATVVYAIANELKYKDDIIYDLKVQNDIDEIGISSVKYLISSGIIMIIISLFISYKKVKEDSILGKILSWPLEVLLILFIVGFFSLFVTPHFINHTINNNEIVEALKYFSLSQNSIIYGINIFNILYWMLILLGTFGVIQVIKYMFGKGIFKYLKENSLIGKFVVYISKTTKKVLNDLGKIDFREDGNKYILKVVLINFVIVSLCCVIWFFGIFGVIIYSIILFYILRKYMNEMKEKYNILLKATNKVAEGYLDVEIEEDLKLFEPFKKELKKIQKGFKKAIEEEVKSQNMKTELITNVSHDLKTPLTSIITYVDLLKDANISEEDRKSYIETIDKKSKRLKTLIEDLFEVSKAGSKDIKLDIVNLDIVELIKQVEIEFNEELSLKNLNIKWINDNEKVILPLDSQKTFRIFENLIGNIAKYSMKDSRVYIEILNEVDHVRITLKNISEVEINYTKEEIIERFKRGDKSRTTEGSGLGLAIAKNFTEVQNGEFNINLDGDLFKVEVKFKKNN